MLIVAALVLGWAGTAGATGGAAAAQKCEAAKLKASGKKAECLLDAEARSVKSGQPPKTSRCVKRFEAAFAGAEKKAGPGVCPTEGDVNDVEVLIDFCRDEVAAALSGSPLPPPCQEFPATGQTNPVRAGDDGTIKAGAPLSYTDNGDGTITDNNTGRTREKKSIDGTIHDVSITYTWENAFAQHVAGLNTAPCFAGQCDWRLPNVKELQSIVDYGRVNPSIDPIFGPTAASFYWSSTTFAFFPALAWIVTFSGGSVFNRNKDNTLHVRAVRGGL
ncbi:MAG: DUF1566 domain-containing protein [Gammaproteobacteria bacterium]